MAELTTVARFVKAASSCCVDFAYNQLSTSFDDGSFAGSGTSPVCLFQDSLALCSTPCLTHKTPTHGGLQDVHALPLETGLKLLLHWANIPTRDWYVAAQDAAE